MVAKIYNFKKHSNFRRFMLDTFSNAFGTIIAQIILSIVIYILRGCVISPWRTLFFFSPFSRYGTEKIVFIYNKAQTFTSSGFAFPQKICIFAENFFKYGKDTNKI